jgi:Zn-dependent alcohol dehydrogenase
MLRPSPHSSSIQASISSYRSNCSSCIRCCSRKSATAFSRSASQTEYAFNTISSRVARGFTGAVTHSLKASRPAFVIS